MFTPQSTLPRPLASGGRARTDASLSSKNHDISADNPPEVPECSNTSIRDTFSEATSREESQLFFAASTSKCRAEMSAAYMENSNSGDCLGLVGSRTPTDWLSSGAVPARTGRNGASCFGLFESDRRPLSISHQHHKHVDDAAAKNIGAIDEALRAAFDRPDEARSIAEILTRMLDEPFFEPPKQIPPRRVGELFDRLCRCPIYPTLDAAKVHAENFVQGYAELLKEFIHESSLDSAKSKLEKRIVKYLRSDRANRQAFEHSVISMCHPESVKRSSVQKMALETFAQAFPLAVTDGGGPLPALKKLIDVLPNLEDHERLNLNAQQHGLRVLQRALDMMPSNDAASALTHLMSHMVHLSQKTSRRNITRKQPQGTALLLLKDQLTSLRRNWGNVTPDQRQQVIEAFKSLKESYPLLAGTKASTLRRLFNDSFIDPSTFETQPRVVVELRRQLHHRVLAPITSRGEPVALPSMPGYATATAAEKKLIEILMRFHNDAQNSGVQDAPFPLHFLQNFGEKTNARGFEDAATWVLKAFSRVKQMPEYKNQSNRSQFLSQIAAMINRLATGDETFVRDFASTCRLADEDCHNNARQILKVLTYCVVADKASKGEDGLDDPGKLVALGRSFFHEFELKKATLKVFPSPADNSFLVDVGNAVEIALGNIFEVPFPIQGMGFRGLADLVTPAKLQAIHKLTKQRTEDKKAFVDFLMSWTPLVKKIEASPELRSRTRYWIAEARAQFEQAENRYNEIEARLNSELDAAKKALKETPPEHRDQAQRRFDGLANEIAKKKADSYTQFEGAAAECQSASRKAEERVLRKMIEDLVR